MAQNDDKIGFKIVSLQTSTLFETLYKTATISRKMKKKKKYTYQVYSYPMLSWKILPDAILPRWHQLIRPTSLTFDFIDLNSPSVVAINCDNRQGRGCGKSINGGLQN